MTTSNNHHGVPLYAKTVMIVQFLTILFFGFWMYQEYQYNAFFQLYVNSFLNDNEFLLIAVFGVLGFLGTGLGMYVRTHGKGHSLELATDGGNLSPTSREPSISGGKLDSHTEQHLIDMIRKTVPPVSTTSSASTVGSASTAAANSGQPLPTLQRVDPNKKTP